MQANGLMYQPLTRYVVPLGEAIQIGKYLRDNGTPPEPFSNWAVYEKRYAGQDATGKRIAILRSPAFGDTLMATPVAKWIMDTWPGVRVDVWAHPAVAELWHGLGVSVYHLPFPFDASESYDWHICYETMWEGTGEKDQGNAYDFSYRFIGVDPDTVDPKYKRPWVGRVDGDHAELKAKGIQLPAPYIVVQVEASNPNRSYPPRMMAEFVRQFIDKHRDVNVVLVGTGRQLKGEFDGLPRNRVKNLAGETSRFRTLVPILENARCGVGPDSAVSHLAEGLGKPFVGLWGLFHPDDRVKYYRHHVALNGFVACPHAPCRSHKFVLPQDQCRDAGNAVDGEQEHCCALRWISPEEILAAVEGVLAANPAQALI